jgi:putative nucleotidyltransferase with HDIG domain
MPAAAAAANPPELALSPLLERLQPLLTAQETPVYLVGGAVRDALLGRTSYDLDFVVPEKAIRLAYTVADALGVPAFALDRERDTGRVILPELQTMLDFARFRAATLEADLRDRDFTINAMALPAGETTAAAIVDPCGGREDLDAGLIRLTHAGALTADPVRTLRAVRLATRLGFALTPETREAIPAAAALLAQVSPERVRDELLKVLLTDTPEDGVAQMAEFGLLPVVLPEIAALAGVAQSPPHHEPVLAHTLSVLRWLVQVEVAVVYQQQTHLPALRQARAVLAPYASRLGLHLKRPVDGGLEGEILLRLGALFHDAGKANTGQEEEGRIRFFGHARVGAQLASRRLRSLHLSNEAVSTVKQIVSGHMRPLSLTQAEKVTRRAIYRFFRDMGAAGLDVALLSLADHLATHDGPGAAGAWEQLLALVARLYEHYFEAYEETIAPPPLLGGRELMDALGIEPGPEIGRLLRLIEEAQAAGEVTSRSEALELAQAAHDNSGR